MFFGMDSRGLSAELTGGNFWEGAAIGLTVSALNQVMHRMSDPQKYNLLEALENNGFDDPMNTDLVEKVPLVKRMHKKARRPEYYAKNNPANSDERTKQYIRRLRQRLQNK